MLKPLAPSVPLTETEVGSDSPTRTCEACGKQDKSHLMINCMIVIGSPGHHLLAPFQCPQVEHWACSPGCWRKVAHACIDEHMHEVLIEKRSSVGEKQ